MTNYSRGRTFEYERVQWHLENGATFACRTAGSHGVFDIIAVYEDRVYLEQLKRTKKKRITSSMYKDDIHQCRLVHTPQNVIKRFVVRMDGSMVPTVMWESSTC